MINQSPNKTEVPALLKLPFLLLCRKFSGRTFGILRCHYLTPECFIISQNQAGNVDEKIPSIFLSQYVVFSCFKTVKIQMKQSN